MIKRGADLLESVDPRVQIAAARLFVEISKIQQKDDHKRLDLEREANRQVNSLTYNHFELTSDMAYRVLDQLHGKPVIDAEPIGDIS